MVVPIFVFEEPRFGSAKYGDLATGFFQEIGNFSGCFGTVSVGDEDFFLLWYAVVFQDNIVTKY